MMGEVSEIGQKPEAEQDRGKGIGGKESSTGGQITRSTAVHVQKG